MARTSLTVAILTFRRPEQLRANLEGVRKHTAEALDRTDPRIVVIDNDPAGSARTTVEAIAATWAETEPVPLVYVHEPRPGIAAARNRALDESGDSRLLSFIDDDEIPESGWLTALVDVWSSTRADAVTGRVVARLPAGTDPWVASSVFFQRTSYATGTVRPAAGAGNLLLDLNTVRRFGLRFDESLGLAGGEDTLFTSQLTQKGGTIVWCQESIAVDPVIPERATRSWVRTRAFAQGNATQDRRLRVATTGSRRQWARARGVAGGAARMSTGALRAAWGLGTRDPGRQQRGESQFWRGWGILRGSFGHRFEEYGREQTAA